MKTKSTDELHKTPAGAPQGKGVLTSGGLKPDPECADQKIQPVDDSEHGTQRDHLFLEFPVIGTKIFWQVLRTDSKRHFFFLAGLNRIFPAGNSLQVRKFVNEVGHQIDFAKPRQALLLGP